MPNSDWVHFFQVYAHSAGFEQSGTSSTVKANDFVTIINGEDTSYGRVVMLLRVIEDENSTVGRFK